MSVHKTKTGWRVMWRENDGRQRQRSFTLRKDAERVDREIQRKRDLAPFGVAIEAKPMTAAELYASWLETPAAGFSPNSLGTYASAWRANLAPRIGTLDVRELTPAVCAELAATLARETGPAAGQKALSLLSSMLRWAVILGRLPAHPMRGAVKVPRTKRARVVNPPTPAEIWRLAELQEPAGRLLVLLVGFAGLRPQEALALDWADVGKASLNVDKAAVQGEIRPTKTGNPRSVTLVPALEAELVAYRLTQGLPSSGPVLAREGRPWRDHDYRNWRRHWFNPAAKALGLDLRVYDLRHAYASLLLHEGRNVVEVAAQLGHSPTVCLDTYGHVMSGLGKRRVTATTAIARAKDVGAALAPQREGAPAE